jgi:hypothetical protein
LEQVILFSLSIIGGCVEVTHHFKNSSWKANSILVMGSPSMHGSPTLEILAKPSQLLVFLWYIPPIDVQVFQH